MKKHFLSVFFLLSLFPLSATAQPCIDLDFRSTTLQSGQIEAPIPVRGNLFLGELDPNQPNGLRIRTEPGNPKATTVFAAGLWLGGIDDGGAYKVAAQAFGAFIGNYDFYPGPLDDSGNTDSLTCQQFNRAWLVRRHEVEAHIEDHAQDGVIDRPITAVYAWPGLGNPFFEAYNGFGLPDYAGELAPFQDVNGDGMYNPAEGDFPRVEDIPYIPEFIHWTIFNDNGDIHRQTNAPEPIQAEIQLTTFAVACTEFPLLNRTIFTQYKVFNRAVEPIDSFYHGFWSDTDLGCHEDDFIGSYPGGHSVFTYNADSIDGFGDQCFCGQHPVFCDRIPVQSHIFLDRDLSKFTYYRNPAFGNPPPGVTDPKNAIEYYRYLSGSWRDGSPLAFGGSGYVPGGDPTDFAFPDDPRDPDGWSMRTAYDIADIRSIASSYIGQIDPGASYTLTMAHSFHYAPGNDGWLDNLGVMYAEVDALQAWYDGDKSCQQPAICRGDDCVWAGDTDANGIVNLYDFLPVAAAEGQTGPSRQLPFSWRPAGGTDWSETLSISHANAKHADAVGDGLVGVSDLQKINDHLGYTRPDHQPAPPAYPQGPEISLDVSGLDIDQVGAGVLDFGNFSVQFDPGSKSIRGLAFTLEYDTLYWKPDPEVLSPVDLVWERSDDRPGSIEFVAVAPPGEVLEAGPTLVFRMFNKANFAEPLPSYHTRLRFRNPVAMDPNGEPVAIGGTDLVATFVNIPVSTAEPGVEGLIFHLAPNPSSGRLILTFGRTAERQVRVLDLLGRQVLAPQEIRGRRESLELNHLPAGLYVVEVREGERLGVKRWLKR